MSIFSRTFHPDEANQAFTTGRLLETGTYSYNPQDHHGPTLYYAAATLQKAAGHHSTATLDPTLLRCTPLLFAVLALVFGALAVRKITGRLWHGLLFSILLGTSPIFVFFATDFIQEMLLAAFTMMMLWAGVSYWNVKCKMKNEKCPSAQGQSLILHFTFYILHSPPPGTWALLFGIAAGLAFATKETAILTFAAAAIALLISSLIFKVSRSTPTPQLPTQNSKLQTLNSKPSHFILAVAGFALTSILFYSSFASNWQGVYNAFIAAPLSYVHRAAGDAASQGAAAHVHPWWQYLYWMFGDEHGFLLFFILCGIGGGCLARFVWLTIRPEARTLIRVPLQRTFLFTLAYSFILLALYSLIPYKTPWCALQITLGLLLAAFFGFSVTTDTFTAANSLGLPPGWPISWKAACDWWPTHPRLLKAIGTMPMILVSALLLYGNICDLIRINHDPDSKDIPYNYASASPQVQDLATLIIDKIASSQKPTTNSQPSTLNSQLSTLNSFVAVVLPPEDTWPLPFYLRSIQDKVGYWTQFGELEALAGLGRKPTVVVVPAEEGHLVQPLFPHLKNTKRFEMRPRVRVRAFW